jgi:putative ABC transport system substrate-binding protein
MTPGRASLSLAAFCLALLAVGVSVDGPAWAQRAGQVYRVGFIRAGKPPDTFIVGLREGLRERGYVDGQNVTIEYRYTDGSLDGLPKLVEELVRLNVDVILASASPPALAAQKVTKSVPVVFVGATDPVALGLVSSLARPGANITGISLTPADLAGKRLELLKELVPGLGRVAVLWRPENPSNPIQLRGVEDAARTLHVRIQALPIAGPGDLEAAFKAAQGADALLQLDDPLLLEQRARITELANKSRLRAMYGFREIVQAGGLMSYGANLEDLYRRSASYVDRILKGAKPADLPVEQPVKFDFVINLRTAKALGVTFPPALLLGAELLE